MLFAGLKVLRGTYHCGDNIMWDPPVLIPNTEVKPHRADGTVRDTVWESRTLPHFIERVRADSPDFTVQALNMTTAVSARL